jgi:hypothetical protein
MIEKKCEIIARRMDVIKLIIREWVLQTLPPEERKENSSFFASSFFIITSIFTNYCTS